MKKRKKGQKPSFKPLPTSAWDIRRRRVDEVTELADALARGFNEAKRLGYARMFKDLDTLLMVAEPWVDRDILRAHIVKDEDPSPGTKFVIAFLPSDGKIIEPTRWYMVPATRGNETVHIVAIGLDETDYRVLAEGWEAFLTMMVSRLHSHGLGS